MSLTWEKIPDTLSRFTVLQATESWAGPGNKAMVWSLQSWNTFKWKAITFSWTHQDQEMLLHVPGSQSIVIGHTQYLWGLAVLVMFQMYLSLCFGYHGGCWCNMQDGDTAVPRSAPKSVLVPGGGIEIPCKYVQKRPQQSPRDNGRQTLQEAQKKSTRLKLTVWLVHCVHVLLTTLRNTRFIFLCEYINPINRTAH